MKKSFNFSIYAAKSRDRAIGVFVSLLTVTAGFESIHQSGACGSAEWYAIIDSHRAITLFWCY